jgi:hypothetical protein
MRLAPLLFFATARAGQLILNFRTLKNWFLARLVGAAARKVCGLARRKT